MNHLLVLNASAGSGKTFRLVGQYLTLALQNPENFRHILAVTFTNKATAEMKLRILDELYALTISHSGKYTSLLSENLGISPDEVSKRATMTMKELLHHYAQFSVFTIDTFFQRVFRSFRYELAVKSGLRIELDPNPVIGYMVERVMATAPEEHKLEKWLISFIDSRIEKGKSWNIERLLNRYGKEFFNETFHYLTPTEMKLLGNLDFMNEFEQKLSVVQRNCEAEVKKMGQQGLNIIREAGYTVDDFSYGQSGVAGFFHKTANNGGLPEMKDRVQKALSGSESWVKKDNKEKNKIIPLVENQLLPLLIEIDTYYKKYEVVYYSIDAILKNIHALAMTGYFFRFLSEYETDNQVMLLSQTPKLIETLLRHDIWFVYEKTGQFYHHLMIDEFQDTSRLQWSNFKPLFDESLSYEKSTPQSPVNKCLLVGDVKQAIYRWRNGDWEILGSEIFRQFENKIITNDLKTNYRSEKILVDFNNTIFTHAPVLLQDYLEAEFRIQTEKITNAYKTAGQECTKASEGEKGFIFINQFKNGEISFTDTALDQTVNALNQLLGKGYQQKDIAILVRKTKEAKALASYLLQLSDNPYRFDVITSEALLLDSCPAIRILTACLEYMAFPGRITPLHEMAMNYCNYIEGKDFYQSLDDLQTDEIYFKMLPARLKEMLPDLLKMPVCDIFNELYEVFQFGTKPGFHAFIACFADHLHAQSLQGNTDLYGILNWWQNNSDKLALQLTEGIDAISILTIHKAKGLEFEAVIIPFCNWKFEPEIKDQMFWVQQADPENISIPDNQVAEMLAYLSAFSKLPVNYSGNLKKTWYEKAYENEKINFHIDNLNLLYVALTRAISALYIFIPDNDKEEAKLKHVGQLIKRIYKTNLEKNIQWQESVCKEMMYLTFGELHKPEKTSRVMNQLALEQLHFSNAFQKKLFFLPVINTITASINAGPDLHGSVMHFILEHIEVFPDIEKSVRKAAFAGYIPVKETQKWIDYFSEKLSLPDVYEWFNGSMTVHNEKSVLSPEGKIFRPDRIMINNDLCILADYKFTAHEDLSHHAQVKNYHRLMQNLGYTNIRAYIWYVDAGKLIREI